MFLTILDLILLLILFIFISFNFYVGFFAAIGALIGLAVGTWAAGFFYAPFASWLTPILLGNAALANIVSFIVIFTVINRLLGLVFWILGKVLKIFSIIPFTKTINRFLGAALGFIEGVLALGLILYFVSQFPFSDWLTAVLVSSKVASWLIWAAGVLTPLLPDVINQAQNVI